MDLGFIIMSVILIYFIIEIIAHNYFKLNVFILIYCGLYINYMFKYI